MSKVNAGQRRTWLVLALLNGIALASLVVVVFLWQWGNGSKDIEKAVEEAELPVAKASPSVLPKPSVSAPVVLAPKTETPPVKTIEKTKDEREPPARPVPTPKGIARSDAPPDFAASKIGATHAAVKGPRVRLEARPPTHPGVDDKKVEQAIARGVAFLKTQAPTEPLLGSRALAGLALLHSGVRTEDAVVRRLAQDVREHARRRSMPYDLACCIWFLDRVGDKRDSPLIRSLALRLIASQQANGGWGYFCPPMTLEQERTLLKLLGGGDLELARGVALPPGGLLGEFAGRLPPDLTRLPVLRYFPGKGLPPPDPGTPLALTNRADNSLTQFAVLGLWASKRHGIPVERSLLMAGERFRLTQGKDGSWTYEGGVSSMRDTATCAGLLALACASDTRKGKDLDDSAIENGLRFLAARLETYRFLHPEIRPKRAAQLAMLFQQFQSFMKMIDAPDLFRPDKGPLDLAAQLLKMVEGGKGINLAAMGTGHSGAWFAADAWGDLYYLWSLERVATAYDLKTIGKRDWYAWGAPIILAGQEADGSWREAFPAVPDTSFALLFLRRANLFLDLTSAQDGRAISPGAGRREQQPSARFPQGQAMGARSGVETAGRAIGAGE